MSMGSRERLRARDSAMDCAMGRPEMKHSVV